MSYESCHALKHVVVEGGLHGVLAHLQQQGCQLLQAHLGHWCYLHAQVLVSHRLTWVCSTSPGTQGRHDPPELAFVCCHSCIPCSSCRALLILLAYREDR